MKELEKIYKALANRRRLEIIKYLKKQKEASVWQLSEHLKLSFKSTSRHLAVLRSVDILEKEQRSLEAYYRISLVVHPVVRHLLSIV